MRADLFLLGYCELGVKADDVPAFLNLCHREGFVYSPLCPLEVGGDVRIRCRLLTARAIQRSATQHNITVYRLKTGGLPLFFHRYRLRAGLWLGGILALLLIWLASGVIWDVRVEGEGELDTERIRQELASCGLAPGCRLSLLDTDEIESRLLTSSDGVAWVSVNIKGTVAYVQVRELLKPESAGEAERGEGGVNLVALCDGRVESVRLVRGEVMVGPGDLIREGQLLISGVRDMGDGSYDVMAAAGEVWARTEHTLEVKIPMDREEKVYVGPKKVKKTLFFFGKPIKITKSTGIIEGNCDTIKKMENVCLFGTVPLPLAIETVEYLPYEIKSVTMTEKEASEQAFAALSDELARAVEGKTLLSQSIRCEITQEHCLIHCTYRCVENIARPQPFAHGTGAQTR